MTGHKIPSGFSLAEDVRVYAISDIHGCLDLFTAQLNKIDADVAQRPCERHMRIFLGDYVDRGPDSRGVIDALIANGKQHECIFIRGNHDTFIPEFLNDPQIWPSWRTMGGLETAASYGLTASPGDDPADARRLAQAFDAALPDSHRRFLADLRPSFALGGVFFTHAGVRPDVSLADQSERDLMWIRRDFLDHEGLFEKFVVHGHTPVLEPDIRPNRINIDTKAWSSGRLTCLWLEGDRFGFL